MNVLVIQTAGVVQFENDCYAAVLFWCQVVTRSQEHLFNRITMVTQLKNTQLQQYSTSHTVTMMSPSGSTHMVRQVPEVTTELN